MGKKKGFWDKFEDLMEAIPGHVENEISTVGNFNSIHYKSSSIVQSGKGTTITQNGKKIVITEKKGELHITVDGKRYVEEK